MKIRKTHDELVNDLKQIGRTPLVIGNRLLVDSASGTMEDTDQREYYYPSDNPRDGENLLIYGTAGSGKTWGELNLMGQSFFEERRSWIMIDFTGAYRGNHLPNNGFRDDLTKVGLSPRGIPKEQMMVCAPQYIMDGMSDEKIQHYQIDEGYKIPVSLLTIPLLFDITKVPVKDSYEYMFDFEWRRAVERLGAEVTIDDLRRVIRNIVEGENAATARLYDNVIRRMMSIEDVMITDDLYSPVGKAIFNSAKDGMPRWIVISFSQCEDYADPIVQAMYAAILREIKTVTEKLMLSNQLIKLGLLVDNMMYISNENSRSYQETKECMYRWGRQAKLFRIWGTQRNEHLPRPFQDSIEDFNRVGLYQQVLKFRWLRDAGVCAYMNKLQCNEDHVELPYFINHVKSAPPMFQVLD